MVEPLLAWLRTRGIFVVRVEIARIQIPGDESRRDGPLPHQGNQEVRQIGGTAAPRVEQPGQCGNRQLDLRVERRHRLNPGTRLLHLIQERSILAQDRHPVSADLLGQHGGQWPLMQDEVPEARRLMEGLVDPGPFACLRNHREIKRIAAQGLHLRPHLEGKLPVRPHHREVMREVTEPVPTGGDAGVGCHRELDLQERLTLVVPRRQADLDVVLACRGREVDPANTLDLISH